MLSKPSSFSTARKQSVYKETGKNIGYLALAAELVNLKRQPETAFLKECHSQVLQQTLMDLDNAFVAFFEKWAQYLNAGGENVRLVKTSSSY